MPVIAADNLAPPALHIPDGFLHPAIALLSWLITLLILAAALRRTQDQIGERTIPLMGVMAAFIFAAQMINFPVAGGTSGHLLGGALAAIVLGPWAGILVMTAVIAVQGLLFQDGGLLVMGANIFNMGILTALIGYGLYQPAARRSRRTQLAAAGAAAWLSVMAGALATSLQLWLSGTTPLRFVLPAMLGVHALIGIGEGLITAAAVAFLLRARPDLLAINQPAAAGRGWAFAGLLASLIVVFLAPLASTNPDGLERVAADLGFLGAAAPAPFSLLSGYTLPTLGETPLSTILAGALGLLVVGTAAAALARLLLGNPAGKP